MTVKRRAFVKGICGAMAGASLSGCAQTPQIGGPDPTDSVRFSNVRWGFHCVPSPCMWALIADMENLTSERLRVRYQLTVRTPEGPLEYEGMDWVDGWGVTEIVVRTDLPDTAREPFDFEIVPLGVDKV